MTWDVIVDAEATTSLQAHVSANVPHTDVKVPGGPLQTECTWQFAI